MTIWRVTFNVENAGGRFTHNVMHVSGGGSESDVGVAVDASLAGLAAASHLFWPVPSGSVIETLDILDVGSTSASLHYELTEPQTGGAGGQIVWQCAGLASIRTTARGPQGRGRLYLGPIGEEAQNAGILDGTGQGVCQTAWNSFRASMIGESYPIGVWSRAHSIWVASTGIEVKNYIATQRKRAKFLQG